jgi:hypothetical protein
MDATVSVELGAEDPVLEVPWQAGALRYFDLKRHPELLLELPESQHNRELAEFLAAMNSPLSMLETVKCDTWISDRMEEEEAIYGAAWKFGCYVDLIFTDAEERPSFPSHENFGKRIARLLRRAPDLPSSAEFIVRRCHYHPGAAGAEISPEGTLESGFYLTFYLFGYGDDEDEARRRWGIALKITENALLQLSAMHRRGSDQTTAPPPETTRVAGSSR